MGRAIDFVCLADSQKLSAHCIAGLRLDGQGWIRPVSSRPGGELDDADVALLHGGSPDVGDVLRVYVTERRPEACQPENYLCDPTRPWEYLGDATWEVLDVIEEFVKDGDLLFGDSTSKIEADSFEICPADASLVLVRPSELCFDVVRRDHARLQPRARFRIGGHSYNLSLTDLCYRERLREMGEGHYSLADVGLDESSRALLTISLGEPYAGYCYKLVAGVVDLDALEAVAGEAEDEEADGQKEEDTSEHADESDSDVGRDGSSGQQPDSVPVASLAMQEAKARHPRAYEAWMGDEEEAVRCLHRLGHSPHVIAFVLQRQPSAVRSRMRRMGL